MRFSIRRNHKIRPLAYREGRNGSSPRSEEEWNIPRAAPPPLEPPAREEMRWSLPEPAPVPAQGWPNGLRAQATGGDARAERLVRAVRMEVADLKQAIGAWGEARDEMLDIDLDGLRESPEAAAMLPPAALVRALATAADRIAELEQALEERDEESVTLQDKLRELHEEHAYTRGRAEMLQEVIAALHANLEDLREQRRSEPALGGSGQRALPAPERSDDPFGMGGAFK